MLSDHSLAYSCFGGILTTVCFFRELTITKKAQWNPYNTRSRSKMENEEGVQEQMKADLSALKDQMASITEAMLKLQKTIEDNATAAASNIAREVEPVLQLVVTWAETKTRRVLIGGIVLKPTLMVCLQTSLPVPLQTI